MDERQGTGDIWWVDSNTGTDSAGYGQNPDAPFATLDFAIGQATANNGDIIHLMEGHAETLSAAADIVIDVAGLTIIGLGQGADRPTFTFDTDTGADIDITAASTVIRNIVGVADIDGLLNPFHVAAADCTLDIEWQDGSAAVEATKAILTTAAADRLNVDLVYRGFTGGNAVVCAVRLVGVDGARINVDFFGIVTTAVVEMITTVCTNVSVTGRFHVSGTSDLSLTVVDTQGSSTWDVRGYDSVADVEFSGGDQNSVAGTDVDAVKTDTAAILIDTAEIGTATDTDIATDIANVQTDTTAILADTATLGAPVGADFSADIASVQTDTTAILADTATLGTPAGVDFAADIAAVQTEVDKIGTPTGADVSTDIANVQTEVDKLGTPAGADVSADIAAVQAEVDKVLGDSTDTSANGQLGTKVTKAAADLLDSVQNALFTISGGRIALTSIVLEVSVAAVDGGASNTNLIYNPTVGTDGNLCGTLDIDGDELGTLYSISGTPGDAMTGGTGGLAPSQARPVVLAEGTIDVVSAADSGTGGALLSAEMFYIPIDNGATVVTT
ncbi:MAG: hypothetical protein Q8Q52_01325 [Acidimicrobiia bacterium]|nr:hypothetical protein [Acidimicrobiia bacterium]